MRREPSSLRRALSAIVAFALGVATTSPAWSQLPGLPARPQTATLADALSRLDTAQRNTTRAGSAVEAEGGPAILGAAGRRQVSVTSEAVPFGSSLFEGGGAPLSDAVNPDYLIQPGDRIGINVLGGASAPVESAAGGGGAAGATSAGAQQAVTIVDPQGNIFLPEVGAVHVGGVRASALQTTIQQAAGRTFTGNVRFYAVLLTTHRIGVYVAGFVARPGRYPGGAADSVLDYLIRAGGVDPSRGSYRKISVVRGQTKLADVDLYQFLLTGRLPTPNLREGDTIFVERQGPTVVVDGAVRNNYLFELTNTVSRGEAVIELARPLPAASNAVLAGTRDGKPFSQYVAVADLARTPILDQDRVTFVSDRPGATVRVRIEGSRIGPSVLVLPTDTRLPAAVAQVQVDPALADVGSVYVLRRSVAEQQNRVMQESMDRLERALFLAVSPTSGVSAIRASEAQLVSTYLQRARRSPPEGRIVVADDAGQLADLRLEDDDVIVIPRKSQTVLVSGEVLQPQAILFRPGIKREDYVRLAGGYSERGRKGRFLVRRANGAFILDKDVTLRPGDELVALPYIDPKYFQLGADVLSLVYQVAIAASVTRNFN